MRTNLSENADFEAKALKIEKMGKMSCRNTTTKFSYRHIKPFSMYTHIPL